MPDSPPDASLPHKRRRRYPGRNPRQFHDKYKELNPEQYPAELQKVLAAGKTPAGTHLPIMVDEVVACLRPSPGEVAVDCTLGGGGHAHAILERLQPGGRLIGLDVDPLELPRTEARLRAAGFGAGAFVARHANFAGVAKALAAEGVEHADVILADLGVSSMQFDNPDRGFSSKGVGPLDMRMNPGRGEPASQVIIRTSEEALARLLVDHADEPHSQLIARLLKAQPLETTHATERVLRMGLTAAVPGIVKADVKMSIRRTFQALRIAVNDEFSALDALLRSLPQCLAPGGRVAVLTFHSGEDRRVKKAFQAGHREGVYADVAKEVIRSTKAETFANRRASSAKLRWAVRAMLVLAAATASLVAQAPRQIQIFAGVLDSAGAPAASVAISDVHVMEDGVDATVTKVERLDWPVKVQLLLDNGVGLGEGSMQPLKAGVRALLAALPENVEVTIVGTAPQPRFLTRATRDRASMQEGLELLGPDRGAGRFVESLLEATQRIERDASDFFPIVISVATTSGDRDMKERDVERIMARLAARPTTVHVVLYAGGPQGVSQAGHVQGAAYTGTNQSRVGMSVAKYSGGTYEGINNATGLASLLPEIGNKVTAAVERYRRQFRITADRPARATGDVGKIDVGVKSPLATAGLSFDGPVR